MDDKNNINELHIHIIVENNDDYIVNYFQIWKYVYWEFTWLIFNINNSWYKHFYYIHNFDLFDIFWHRMTNETAIEKIENTHIISYNNIQEFIKLLFKEVKINNNIWYKVRKNKIKDFINETNDTKYLFYKYNNIKTPLIIL